MILEDFNSNKDSVIRRICELVDIESPTCDQPSLSKAADWLVSQAQTIPAITTIERIRREGYGEHLIFRAFEGVGRPVLLIGHYDTVHPLGTKEKNPTRHEDGRLFGCGVFDMKANLVLILEALRAVAENGASSRQINIFISCDEEVGSPTGREIVEREASIAEHVLIFEPSLDGKAKTGRKGTASFIIKTHGIPAHAGLEPEKGASAIAELAKQILEIEKMNRPEKGTSVNATIVKGGTASNVIASEAECELDIRFTDLDEA
ncbi:MAG: M20/M25/M40 family metallo-hydrolase, partial [Acidobacteriota bacterium]